MGIENETCATFFDKCFVRVNPLDPKEGNFVIPVEATVSPYGKLNVSLCNFMVVSGNDVFCSFRSDGFNVIKSEIKDGAEMPKCKKVNQTNPYANDEPTCKAISNPLDLAKFSLKLPVSRD